MAGVAAETVARVSDIDYGSSVVAAAIVGSAIGVGCVVLTWFERPGRTVGPSVVLALYVVLAAAMIPVFGCSGKYSCIRPLPDDTFPAVLRAFSAGMLASALAAWAVLLLPRMLFRRRG